jgi:Fe-S-cluster-containing dehydrogenase component/formate-dependent nitrite reductase membrane component NrfD
MRYGVIIDNRKCIGCHACTVACKTENRVPLGVNRTWVKYVEKGRFPHVRRVFQVTRCNHCEKPPCVEICPVGAMYQRKDGIVDFNSVRCIGCKACMQACPYDAIYVDPDRNTAAKCHFCAHRTEVGLEPACAAVCPERAIIAGDLDQPDSEIARLLARETVRVRKPEQGTKPKVFYIDGDQSTMDPTAARHEALYMWSQRNDKIAGGGAVYPPDSPYLDENALAAYDVSHGRPWGWQVPVYFWLKSIGSGLLAVPAIAMAMGRLPFDRLRGVVLSTLALIFIAATVVMLVSDLSRKERFLGVLKTPQSRSWLSRGAFILVIYSVLCGLFWLLGLTGYSRLFTVLLWPTVLAGFLAAGYTAFLFGQCEGCDLWQTPLLPLHMVVQAVLSSAAVLAMLPAAFGGTPEGQKVAVGALSICMLLHLLILLGEIAMPHATDNAGYAARLITHGPYRTLFWVGAVVLGGIIPALLLLVGASNSIIVGLSGLLALAGLLAFEWCFVMAGQSVPNS